jgi:hypothetical protein
MLLRGFFASVGLVLWLAAGAPPAQAAPADYPTEALADYVFGCIATNGQTQTALQHCSCSIDHIAAQLPYTDYVKAETVLRMRQLAGGDDRVMMFRAIPEMQTMVDKLRRAQLEAESKCF